MFNITELIQGYDQWIREWIREDREVYFLTIQFNHLHGDSKTVMETEITRFYNALLTRLIRNPRRKGQADRLPVLVAVPDRPVGKHGKATSWADSRPNSGVHYHALLAAYPDIRLRESLPDHMQAHGPLYLGRERKISEIHIMEVDTPGSLADYTFKHIKRGSFHPDDILLFPRARSELPARSSRQSA